MASPPVWTWARPGRIAGTGRWGEDPWSLVPLAIALGLYIAGLIWLWRKAGSGRGISFRHAAAFGAGWLILAVALQSPLHFWGERMFSAHMVEHEIVMVVAAPLLVVSRPLIPFLWAMPIAWRRKLGGMRRLRGFRPIWEGATRPLTAWIAHAAVLWVWHIPAVFRAALASEALHAVQHLCFLAAALLYWWSLLCRREGADMQGAGVISLFATSVQTALLGALLTVSSVAWYGTDPRFAAICGLTPLEDQQLAGLIMWVPAGLTYVGAALVLMLRLFGAAERRAQTVDGGPAALPLGSAPVNRNRITWIVLFVLIAAGVVAGAAALADKSAREDVDRQVAEMTGGDPHRGQAALKDYGCVTCHTIPGVAEARGLVGPPLTGFANRVYVGGVAVNSVEDLIAWIRDPPSLSPRTAMPAVGLPEDAARDIAAYLYTIR